MLLQLEVAKTKWYESIYKFPPERLNTLTWRLVVSQRC